MKVLILILATLSLTTFAMKRRLDDPGPVKPGGVISLKKKPAPKPPVAAPKPVPKKK